MQKVYCIGMTGLHANNALGIEPNMTLLFFIFLLLTRHEHEQP